MILNSGIEEKLANEDGERRWTAVLCADLVNFTGFSAQLGPERTYELMRPVMNLARSEIEKHQGSIEEYAGDAVYAVFGAPVAVENASLEACRAALKIQKMMEEQAEDFQTEFGVKPQFRIGLAGGFVVFGSVGENQGLDINMLGDAVNFASRIQKKAPPGTVICSEGIHNQVEGFVDVDPVGPTQFKGINGTHTTYIVNSLRHFQTAVEGRISRGSKEFFGRQDEMQQLQAWLDSKASPVAEVSGPPGAGKSRLVREFVKRNAGSASFLTGQCNESTMQTPLLPIVDIIREEIGWNPTDSRGLVEERLAAHAPVDSPAFDYLVDRIGKFESKSKSAYQHSDNAIEIRRFCAHAISSIANQSGKLFLIEDVHWLDSSSEAVFVNLISQDAETACRFVTTRREYILREWSDLPAVRSIALQSLDADVIRKLVLELLKADTADDALIELTYEKSEGIPLFVEEIVRYLQFSGAVEFNGAAAKLKPGAGENIVSGNLQHLMLSRFDALPADDRTLLTFAATKGRFFSTEFLTNCGIESADPKSCIERAIAEGLVEDDPSGGADSWRFSHALISDAICGSQLAPKKRENHEVVATALEKSWNREKSASLTDELAYHYNSAGNREKAIKYLQQSAEKAYEVFAVVQVDAQLETAFSLIEAQSDLVDDETFGEMLFLWGRTLDIYGQFRKLNAIMDRHLPRLRKSGPSEVLSLCMSLKALARCHAAEFHDAQAILDESMAIADKIDNELPSIWAKVIQMRINVDSGFANLAATEALYNEVKPKAEQLQDSHLIQLSTYVMMTAHRAAGALKRANEYLDWLDHYGQTHKSARAIAMCAWAKCINHLVREQLDQGIEAAEENLRLTVAPTGDWRVASVGRLVARLGRGDKDVAAEDLIPFIEMLDDFDDTTLGNAARQQFWIHTISRGQLRYGWQGLKKLSAQIEGRCTPELRRFLELVQAEVLMSIAGVLPRNGARPKMGPLDYLTAARLRLNAKAKAKDHLQEFLAQAPSQSGYFVARVERDLGLIAKSQGDLGAANTHLKRSIKLYDDEDMFETALAIEQLLPE